MEKFLLKPPNPNLKRAAEDLLAQQDAKKTSLDKPVTEHEKINIPTHNRYEALSLDRELNPNSNTSATKSNPDARKNEATAKSLQNATTLVKKTGHIPPIILAIKPEWTHESIKTLVSNYTNRFHLQYRSNKKIAVYCYSPEAHKALREGLKASDAPFLTYTRKDERTPKVVVKGLPDYADEVISDELKKLGFDGVTVTKLKSAKNKNPQCPPFLIQLANGASLENFRKIRYLCHCVVKIEKYKPKLTGTQCFRCQEFGHSSRNCNMPPRCVKCTEAHATSDCHKIDRKEPAQCCNCKEAHPANYSKCSARLSYLEKTKQKKVAERRPPPPMINKQNPWFTKIITEPLTVPTSPCPTENVSVNNLHQHAKNNTSSLRDSDAATKEMLDILMVIRSIKKQFMSCTSTLEKVILVLTRLGHYV
ncbi:hypothetical protein O0L34_g10833 [Tuta absoluta]|nr:hypothetical protein O0L34_g10833 [Tuta absoluta]